MINKLQHIYHLRKPNTFVSKRPLTLLHVHTSLKIKPLKTFSHARKGQMNEQMGNISRLIAGYETICLCKDLYDCKYLGWDVEHLVPRVLACA